MNGQKTQNQRRYQLQLEVKVKRVVMLGALRALLLNAWAKTVHTIPVTWVGLLEDSCMG